jgi:(E)-4-hydroxy-3-methylbut-2-enyl-diphosphate synthase
MKTNIKLIKIGPIKIGNNSPISVQTMTNTPTHNIEETLAQINRCADLGCDLIRVSVPNQIDADALSEICKKSPIPIIADIHFNHTLAISSIENGAAAIRINPGNIASDSSHDNQKLKNIADCANQHNIPIRVGVNSGSLEKTLLARYGKHNPHALVQSAFKQCQRLEQLGFSNIKVSIKSSTVLETIEANKLFRLESIDKYQKTGKLPYPLHIGITETGLPSDGIIKSAVGIGSLLTQHIGETIRVSLTASPEEEIKAGIKILEACGLRIAPIEIISCPGCARASNFPLETITQTIKQLTEKMSFKKPLKIAIMGCIVNGPGEAKDADLGISGLNKTISIFSHGKIIKTIQQDQIIPEFQKLLKAYTN